MNYFFITGTSRGIGKALAEEILKSDKNFITGISRTKTIENQNYKHILIDLGDLKKIENFKFDNFRDAQKIVLINNSAVLGEVNQLGKKSNSDIVTSFNINTIAPAILMNKFIAKYQDFDCERIILNISSGSGRYPTASWSTYCSTKAALDMFGEVADKEQKEMSENKRIRIFSVAPGIVDTKLQEEIRSVEKVNFSKSDIFKAYKNENKLDNPQKTASLLLNIINNTQKFNKVCLDVREIN